MNAWRIPLPPRHWLRLRLRTAFLLATALCVYLAWPHVARQYAIWHLRGYGELRRYGYDGFQNKDGRLVRSDHVGRLLEHLVPARDYFWHVKPGYGSILCATPISHGRARFAIVQEPFMFRTPGENPIRILLLDGRGNIVLDADGVLPNRFHPIDAWCELEQGGSPRFVVASGRSLTTYSIQNGTVK